MLIRLREERAAERRKQDARAAWRQLLRSIWTHLRLQQDYGDNAALHAGQHHAGLAEASLLREDLSGGSPLQLLMLCAVLPGAVASTPCCMA